jgi:hypothetical protein
MGGVRSRSVCRVLKAQFRDAVIRVVVVEIRHWLCALVFLKLSEIVALVFCSFPVPDSMALEKENM